MLGKSSGAGFFFDNFAVQPSALFACEKMISTGGSVAFVLNDNYTNATGEISVFFDPDGKVRGTSSTDSGTWPTLSDAIAANRNVIRRWIDQMNPSTRAAYAIAGGNPNLIKVTLDANGYAKISNTSSSTALYYTSRDIATNNAISYTINQPITILQRTRFVNHNSFKPGWRLFDSNGTTVLASWSDIRLTSFGVVNFGTFRTITDTAIFNADTVVQFTGNGASGNVWVDNVPKNPANMGVNGINGRMDFLGDRITTLTHHILLPNELTTSQRTALYDHINAY